MKYLVKWTTCFTEGHLEGISIDCELDFPTLDLASNYVAFLHRFTETPFRSEIDGTVKTFNSARIVSGE